MKMSEMPISELALVNSGGGAPQDPSAFSISGHPFIRAGSLAKLLDGIDEMKLELLSPEVASSHNLKLFPAGTILFAKSGMSATKGLVYKTKNPAYVVNHLAALVPKNEQNGQILLRALEENSPSQLVKDSAYPSIRLGDIEDFKIEVPSAKEDRDRIIKILDKADELRRLRQNAINCSFSVTETLFHQLFGCELTSTRPDALSEIVDIRSSLVDPTKAAYRSYSHVSPEHIPKGSGEIDWSNVRSAAEDGITSGKYEFFENDVLYSKIRPYLNKVAVADRQGLCSADMYPLKLLEGPSDAFFVKHLLMSLDFLSYANGLSGRANIPKINRKQLEGYRFKIPNKNIRDEFDLIARDVSKKNCFFRESGHSFERLYASLQQRAFRGEL